MASENEARIRAKTEAALRAKYPLARIVHEIPLEAFAIRLDLAAITPTKIVVAEIKSEKDTLTRLQAQVKSAISLACETWVVYNEKHAPKIKKIGQYWHDDCPDKMLGRMFGKCFLMEESAERRELKIIDKPPLNLIHAVDGRNLFNVMWAEEQAACLKQHGLIPLTKKHPNRNTMLYMANENLSVKQIRAAVCAALLGREFAKAD